MGTLIGSQGLLSRIFDGDMKAEYEASHRAREDRDTERWRTEQQIIEHTEKATGTKAITVDGELKYVHIAEAKKLGLA